MKRQGKELGIVESNRNSSEWNPQKYESYAGYEIIYSKKVYPLMGDVWVANARKGAHHLECRAFDYRDCSYEMKKKIGNIPEAKEKQKRKAQNAGGTGDIET